MANETNETPEQAKHRREQAKIRYQQIRTSPTPYVQRWSDLGHTPEEIAAHWRERRDRNNNRSRGGTGRPCGRPPTYPHGDPEPPRPMPRRGRALWSPELHATQTEVRRAHKAWLMRERIRRLQQEPDFDLRHRESAALFRETHPWVTGDAYHPGAWNACNRDMLSNPVCQVCGEALRPLPGQATYHLCRCSNLIWKRVQGGRVNFWSLLLCDEYWDMVDGVPEPIDPSNGQLAR